MKSAYHKNFAVMIFSFAALFCLESYAMLNEYIFSSKIEGKLLLDDKPLANVQIKRRLSGDGVYKKGEEDFVTTVEDGSFSFPILKKRKFFEPGLSIAVKTIFVQGTVEFLDNKYYLFTFQRSGYGIGGEGRGERINVVCDIAKYKIFQGVRVVDCEYSSEKGDE